MSVAGESRRTEARAPTRGVAKSRRQDFAVATRRTKFRRRNSMIRNGGLREFTKPPSKQGVMHKHARRHILPLRVAEFRLSDDSGHGGRRPVCPGMTPSGERQDKLAKDRR